MHDAGAAISVQITHAGSFADRSVSGLQQLAPSVIFNHGDMNWSKAMTMEELETVKEEFVRGSELIQRVGFDSMEIHCGHRYLLSQFLSPFTNARTDLYGGSERIGLASRVR